MPNASTFSLGKLSTISGVLLARMPTLFPAISHHASCLPQRILCRVKTLHLKIKKAHRNRNILPRSSVSQLYPLPPSHNFAVGQTNHSTYPNTPHSLTECTLPLSASTILLTASPKHFHARQLAGPSTCTHIVHSQQGPYAGTCKYTNSLQDFCTANYCPLVLRLAVMQCLPRHFDIPVLKQTP